MNDSKLNRGEYCSKYIKIAYQNCLALLNRNDLLEINLFYNKIPSFNHCDGKIENIGELREKIQEAYETLADPKKRKEYDFEIFGIFGREYPEDEVADDKFKDKAILLLEEDDKLDEKLKHIYWKNYLTSNY